MNRKIFKSMSLVVCMSIIISYVLIAFLIYGQFFENMKKEVRNEAMYVKIAMDKVGHEYLEEIHKRDFNSRFTLINLNGEVLFESKEDKDKMENHLNRPEIIEAINGSYGDDVRLSKTLGEQTFYYAVKLSDNTILRVSNTVDSVFASMKNSIVFVILIFIMVLCISMLIAKRVTKKLITPINKLDLEKPLENDIYDELTPLLHRIYKQNNQIKDQMIKLKEKQEEFNTITENMKEGLIILDKKENILSINKTAINLFEAEKSQCINKHILKLSRNSNFQEAVEKSFHGDTYDTVIEIKKKYFSLISNPVIMEGVLKGVVILILDVTEKHKSEQLRKEFSANVSHELKTPLMSISGYAELMKNNMVKDKDISEFSNRIYNEGIRLTKLVEDIINLSRLDEKNEDLEYEEVDLFNLCQEVCRNLLPYAESKNVSIEVHGHHARISGVKQIIQEVIFNLCDNAIKYNKNNGEVKINLIDGISNVELIISDTGIGIPEEEQERIFERFYRVDKSHSRDTGGTGLGLSIVKHGVALHNGEIKVSSKTNQGTSIKITFKRENF